MSSSRWRRSIDSWAVQLVLVPLALGLLCFLCILTDGHCNLACIAPISSIDRPWMVQQTRSTWYVPASWCSAWWQMTCDRSTRPRRPIFMARVEEEYKWKQMGWDGMGWAIGRWYDTAVVVAASAGRPVPYQATTAIDRRDDRRWSYARPAGGTGHRSAFDLLPLRLLVGGYGASAMSCPRRKIELNSYKILAILEKPSLWTFFLSASAALIFHGPRVMQSVGSLVLPAHWGSGNGNVGKMWLLKPMKS